MNFRVTLGQRSWMSLLAISRFVSHEAGKVDFM